MKRKLTALILAALLTLTALPASAAIELTLPGEPLGWVLYSDIVAYINGTPIRSYNINGLTYVVAEELAEYGFSVNWYPDEADGLLTIGSGSGRVIANYTPESNTHRPGDRAMPYLYTRIMTYMAGQPVFAANIGGLTCVAMDDLAYFYAADYVWDNVKGELHLTLRENCTAAIPGDYAFTYVTPGYDADRAVDGEGAMWEFTKQADGTFALTDASGTTDFVMSLLLEDDRMEYRVQHKKLEPGVGIYEAVAPHTTAAHRTIADTIAQKQLYLLWGNALGPQYFRGYAMQNILGADELLTMARRATAVWRVYVNGTLIPGLPTAQPSSYYSGPGGRDQLWRTYTYLYDRRIPLDQVQTIRIELGPAS